jgi:hypothetical protein
MLISMRLNRRGWEDALRDFASARTMTVDVGAVHGGRTVGPLRSICGSVYPQRQRIEQGEEQSKSTTKAKVREAESGVGGFLERSLQSSPHRVVFSMSVCFFRFFMGMPTPYLLHLPPQAS